MKLLGDESDVEALVNVLLAGGNGNCQQESILSWRKFLVVERYSQFLSVNIDQ